MSDGNTLNDEAEPARSRADPSNTGESLSGRLPGMAPNAPKRNALVVLGSLLGAALLIAVFASAL